MDTATTAPRAPMLAIVAERPHGVRRGCPCCAAPAGPRQMRRAQRRRDRQAVRAAHWDAR